MLRKNIFFVLCYFSLFTLNTSSATQLELLKNNLQILKKSMGNLSLKLESMNKNLNQVKINLKNISAPSPEDTFKESSLLTQWEIQQKITAAGDKLKKLVLKNRDLTTLDCSQNINLEELYAEDCKNLNEIHGLDFKKFKKLTAINCPLQKFDSNGIAKHSQSNNFFLDGLESLTLQNNLIKTSFDCLLYEKINELSLIGCSNITKINLSNTIKKLDCTNCINLQECSIISLKDAVQIIFKNCEKLTAIKSDSNKNDDVFKQTINLKKIDFTGCSKLILNAEEKKSLKDLQKKEGCSVIGINLD